MPPLSPAQVYVDDSAVHGRGVFAARAFEPDDEIEVAPVLAVPSDQKDNLEETDLWGYYYEWEDDGIAVALGCASLYNHSWSPNARYEQDYDEGVVRIVAVQPIAPGEEITINYTGDPDGRDELWFDAAVP